MSNRNMSLLRSISFMLRNFQGVWTTAGRSYRWLIPAVIIVPSLILWGRSENIAGNMKVNATFLLIALAVVTFSLCIPLIWNRCALTDEQTDEYAGTIASVDIWITVVFGGLWLLTLKYNPDNFDGIIICAIIIALAFKWGYEPSWARPVIYTSVCVLIVSYLLVPAANTFSPTLFGCNIGHTKTDSEIEEFKVDQVEKRKKTRWPH